MYYILKEDIKDRDELINWLESEGFRNSEYSCKKRNMCAIAIHFSGPYGGRHAYILCSDKMCNSNPYISWLNCRKRCWTQEEFITALKEKIDNTHKIDN